MHIVLEMTSPKERDEVWNRESMIMSVKIEKI